MGLSVPILLGLFLTAQTVAAQPGLTPPSETPPQTAANPDEHSDDGEAKRGVTLDDPQGDRGFLTPTALVQPKGSYTVHDRMYLIPGITYGLTDKVQISLITAIAPAISLGGEVKVQVMSKKNLHVALTGLFGGLQPIGIEGMLTVGFVGLSATYCRTESCGTSLTGSLFGGRIAITDNDDDYANALFGSALMLHRVASTVKLMAEFQLLRAYDGGTRPETLVTFTGGLRLHGKKLAVDIGLITFAAYNHWSEEWEGDESLLADRFTPWLNIGYRWGVKE